jgi:hypothetical protein
MHGLNISSPVWQTPTGLGFKSEGQGRCREWSALKTVRVEFDGEDLSDNLITLEATTCRLGYC